MQFFNGINSYFQYAGAIYPVGLVGDGRTIHFSTALIDKVLKEGYSDEQEEAYIYVVKEELLIDKNMNSFGFAPKEDLEEYKRRAMKNDKN